VWTLPASWSGTSSTNSISATAGAANGTITVVAKNGCGSSAAQTVAVVSKASPTVVFNYGAGPICTNHNSVVTLSATPAGGAFSGQGVSGSTFNASSLTPGNYVVAYTYTNAQGCSAGDTATLSVKSCTGISNTEVNAIEVYPNPFNDEVTIKTDGNFSNGKVIVMDAIGNLLSTTEMTSGSRQMQLNTSGLAKGVYLINIVIDGRSVAVRKLSKAE
jgi:hypothetical protein